MLFLITHELFVRITNSINIKSTEDTLEIILRDEKSISRFGDGEFDLILGKDLKFQSYTPELALKMEQILHDKDLNEKCLVAVPSALASLKGFTIKSKIFWIKYGALYRKQIIQLLNAEFQYYDSQISRIYINRINKNKAAHYFEMWKEIWKNKRVVIFEGSLSRFGVGNTLLDDAKSIQRVICPSENAYSSYDEILKVAMDFIEDSDLFLFSLGPTATVLAYEISKYGIQCIDTGNMDMEYEWLLRGTKKKVAISNKYSLEVKNGTSVADCNDDVYLKQIVKVL